jgi:large subunit ribosomal protein L21
MFAVIRTGGKQYRVAKDDKIVVEKLGGEPGAMVELSDVLMIGGDGEKMTVGAPVIDKASVFAEVVEQSRANKILVFKKNRRKNYRRTRGHRQEQTVLRIVDVSPSGTKPQASTAKSKPEKINVTKAADRISDKKFKTKTTVKKSDKKVQAKITATKSGKKNETKAKTTAKEKSSVKKIVKKNPNPKE